MKSVSYKQIYAEAGGELKTSLVEGNYNVSKETGIVNTLDNSTMRLMDTNVVEIGESIFIIPRTVVREYINGKSVVKDIPDKYRITAWRRANGGYGVLGNSPYVNQTDDNITVNTDQLVERPDDSALVAITKRLLLTTKLNIDYRNAQYISSIISGLNRGQISYDKACNVAALCGKVLAISAIDMAQAGMMQQQQQQTVNMGMHQQPNNIIPMNNNLMIKGGMAI